MVEPTKGKACAWVVYKITVIIYNKNTDINLKIETSYTHVEVNG